MLAPSAPDLRAILFDMDGTLADTEELHRQSFNRAFAEFHLDIEWSRAEYHDLLSISGGRERIRRYLQHRRIEADDAAALLRLTGSLHQRKSALYREMLRHSHMTLRPGIRRLIDEARGCELRLGIATSSSRQNVETLLAATLGKGATALFQAVVTSDEVEEKKPSPAVYLHALSQLGETPPHCVAIEDTRNGNLSARAAGLTTVITTHAFTVDNDFAGAALVLDQLGESGRPFRVIAGDAHGATRVDVPLLRRLLAASQNWARNGATARYP
ncbi:MAG: HAD-IA family hydrolase [Gammaproteobacteria bacterium]|nr:HAD-IA family hydrolase [Gammaproteobacteria bacterium]